MLRYAVALATGALLVMIFGGTAVALTLTSPAFSADAAVPKQFSCDAGNRSPELRWTDAPKDTKTFALVVDDPDAPSGTFVHWVLYDLPGDVTGLPEGVPPDEPIRGGTQGMNSAKKRGYAGPCPPAGKPHHYRFTLYALGAPTGLKPGASKDDVLHAIEGHVVAQTTLVGTYQR